MTPERKLDLVKLSAEMERWEYEDLASEQECMSCHDGVHTPSDLEPTPLCNLCAQRTVGAVPHLLYEIELLKSASTEDRKFINSQWAELQEARKRIAELEKDKNRW